MESLYKETNKANQEFWAEPCGTNTKAYRKFGFKSREAFDSWYFGFYPYLEKYIPFENIKSKRVLEVGLGLGTVSERLANEGAIYYGMDIAEGPVAEVKGRLGSLRLNGEVILGNVLECPWDDNYFDFVISIGCLHHTGSLVHAIGELIRVLKPGGIGILMVYNAFSYRQWLTAPCVTWRQLRAEGNGTITREASKSERGMYDINTKGDVAPCTEFMGKRSMMNIMESRGAKATIHTENVGNLFMFPIPRKLKLKLFGSWLGLDLYVTFTKSDKVSI